MSGGDTMSGKRRKGRNPLNRAHVSLYGMRDTECPRCKVLLRKEDFTSAGICAWCAWELDEPIRVLLARMAAQRESNNPPPLPSMHRCCPTVHTKGLPGQRLMWRSWRPWYLTIWEEPVRGVVEDTGQFSLRSLKVEATGCGPRRGAVSRSPCAAQSSRLPRPRRG